MLLACQIARCPLNGRLIARFVCSTNSVLLERCSHRSQLERREHESLNHRFSLHDLPATVWIVGVYRLGQLACLGSQVLLHDVSLRVHEESHNT